MGEIKTETTVTTVTTLSVLGMGKTVENRQIPTKTDNSRQKLTNTDIAPCGCCIFAS